MKDQFVTSEVCAKMVESATRACQPMIALPPEPANSTADSLSGLATAFTYGSMLLAVFVLIAGYGWARYVAREAKEMAKADVQHYISKWLANTAPGIVQNHVNLLVDATVGPGDDATAADDLGENAG